MITITDVNAVFRSQCELNSWQLLFFWLKLNLSFDRFEEELEAF